MMRENGQDQIHSISTFKVTNSDETGIPLGGKTLQVHPVPSAKERKFKLVPVKHAKNNYCPSYFKTFSNDNAEGSIRHPCRGLTPICKFTGFGGYVCCSKIDHGKCSEKNMCDNTAGQFFNDRTMKCECRAGFVLVGDECQFELTRQVRPKVYEEEYDYEQYQFPEYENDGSAPMMRSAFVNQDPAAQRELMEEVSSTTQRVTTKSDKKSADQNEEALDLCFGKGCDDTASVQVGKKKKNKADRLANRLGLWSTGTETSTETSSTTEQVTSAMSSTSSTTTTTTTTTTTKKQMKLEVVDASGPVVKMKPNLKMASETGPLPPAVLEKLRQMQLMDPTTTMYPETTQYYTEFSPLQADTDIYQPMSRQFGFVGSLPVEDSLDESSSTEDISSDDSAPIAGALPFDHVSLTTNVPFRAEPQVVTTTTTKTTAPATTTTTTKAATTTQQPTTAPVATTKPVATTTTAPATTIATTTISTTELTTTTTTTPAPITTTTEPITTTSSVVDEWSTWGACSASCGNGEEKRTKGTQVETRKCHIKFCSREVWLLSMMMPSDALLPVMHAGESGDTFLLKLMLYQNDIETIFAYAMQADSPADETPTDVVNQFIRFKMFYQASMPTQGQTASSTNQVQANLMPLIFLKSAAGADEVPEQPVDQGKIDYLVNAVKMDNVINHVQS